MNYLERIRSNPIEDLVAVEVPSSAFREGHWLHAAKNSSKLLMIETCERALLVTKQSDWDDLGEEYSGLKEKVYPHTHGDDFFKDGKKYRKFSGVEAYQFLLESACGLRSNNAGEEQISSQIAADHKSFVDRTGNTSFSQIFQKLAADYKGIRTHLLKGYQHLSEERVAIDLMNLDASSQVLLISDCDEMTRAFFSELTNNVRGAANPASIIDIKVMSESSLKDIAANVAKRKIETRNDDLVATVNVFEEVPDSNTMSLYNGVIIIADMEKNAQKLKQLVENYSKIESEKPKLLIFDTSERGVLDQNRQDHDLAQDGIILYLMPEDAISAEAVKTDLEAKKQSQDSMVRVGRVTCEVVAKLREKKFDHNPDVQKIADEISGREEDEIPACENAQKLVEKYQFPIPRNER